MRYTGLVTRSNVQLKKYRGFYLLSELRSESVEW